MRTIVSEVDRFWLAGMVLLAMLLAGCGSPAPQSAGRALVPAPRILGGELDAKVLLAELPQKATKLGAGPAAIVAAGEALEGDKMGGFVDVPPDLCALVYARGSTSVDDLDVAVFSDEGTPLAVDEAPDAHPTVLLCPPHPDRVYATVHVAGGEGLVAIAAQLVARDRAVAVGKSLGARGALGDGPRPAEAWPGLDDHVRAHRQLLGGHWEDFRKVALSVDSRSSTFLPFLIDADQCVDAVIVPSDEVALIDAEALDGEGRVIARAHEGGRIRTLTVCSPIGVQGTLSIRPHVGRGLLAVVLGRGRGEIARDLTTRPDVSWAAPSVTTDLARAARNQDLAKAGYEAPKTTLNGVLAMGRRTTMVLDSRSAANGCVRIDVLAGKPLALFSVALRDDSGNLIATGEGAASTTLFSCAHAQLRLDLEARGRPGPFTVVARPEKWRDPAFSAHPLASGRMLARAGEGTSVVLEGAPVSVKATSLDPSRLMTWTEQVPAGKCLRVAVGTQGEGAGIELRVFDSTNASELDRSHAATGASVRACAAADALRTVKIELRALAGKLDAVVGERMLP